MYVERRRGRQKCEGDWAPRAPSSCTIRREERGKYKTSLGRPGTDSKERERERILLMVRARLAVRRRTRLFQSAINEDNRMYHVSLSRDSRASTSPDSTFVHDLAHASSLHVPYIIPVSRANKKNTSRLQWADFFFLSGIWGWLSSRMGKGKRDRFTIARRSGRSFKEG